MSNEIKVGDIVVFNTGDNAFDIIGKYIVTDDRLWRVEAITENDPPTPDRNRRYRLVAVDCPNVMLDEIPERYIEPYSDKLERELEEQRKEALKMNRNEIKVGDKVRVSKDAPRIYTPDWTTAMFDLVLKVTEVEDDNAMVEFEKRTPYRTVLTTIPTKYLVKVDAEAKEARFKRGDKVVSKPPFVEKVWTVFGYDDKMPYMVMVGDGEYINERNLEPYTEPTKQTEAEHTKTKGDILTFPIAFDLNEALEGCDCFVSIREQMRKTLRDMEENNKPRYVPKIMFNTEFWVKYEADLAKEVALKVANKYNDPEEAAEYAVSVAKAVVEGLKRK